MTFSPRSLLFTPGDRPERFAKGLAAADAICLDLEDAVHPAAKAAARDHVLAFIAQTSEPHRVAVRINALNTHAGLVDAAAFASNGATIGALMVAKTEQAPVLAHFHEALAEAGRPQGLIALIESAQGLRRAASIARVTGVVGLALGPLDLAAQLRARLDGPALDAVRLNLRLAAAEADIEVWDGPSPDLDDADGLDAQARAAAVMGFTGKLCIHPRQAAVVDAAFAPPATALAWAKAVLAAAAANPSGVFSFEGQMIDAPVIASARRLLARATPQA